MSMLLRMTTETGTPVPRWLYLFLKPVETLAGGVALAQLLVLPVYLTTWLVAIIYVFLGQWAWYRHRRIVVTTGPGQFLGDFLYHGVLSYIAVVMVTPWPWAVRWAAALTMAGLWWVLEVNNYGPMRDPSVGLTS